MKAASNVCAVTGLCPAEQRERSIAITAKKIQAPKIHGNDNYVEKVPIAHAAIKRWR
jgi:hypothetical protein